MNEEKVKMLNIFLLGLCFCLVFTGFNSMGQNQVNRNNFFYFVFAYICERYLRNSKLPDI